MAFNGSGTFARLYNWVNDKAALVKITASRMDAEMDGMATGLSTAILKDGQQTTTAAIPFAVGINLNDGTAGTPSAKFINDTDTGLYSAGANELGLAAGGAKIWGFGTATASAAGALVVGGTFRVSGATRACRVYKDSNTSITYNTRTAISFNQEDHDAAAMHSTSADTSKITVPYAGIYLIQGMAHGAMLAGATNYTLWRGYIKKNGTTDLARDQSPANFDHGLVVADVCQINVMAIVSLAANDYVEFEVYQANTGTGALNLTYESGISPYFSVAQLV